jgi:hypothetical protein
MVKGLNCLQNRKKKLFLACFARIIEKDIYIKMVVLFLIKEKNFCKKSLFRGIDGMGWDGSIVTKFR